MSDKHPSPMSDWMGESSSLPAERTQFIPPKKCASLAVSHHPGEDGGRSHPFEAGQMDSAPPSCVAQPRLFSKVPRGCEVCLPVIHRIHPPHPHTHILLHLTLRNATSRVWATLGIHYKKKKLDTLICRQEASNICKDISRTVL